MSFDSTRPSEDAVERVARAIAKVSLESPHGRDCLCEQCGLARARAAIEAMPLDQRVDWEIISDLKKANRRIAELEVRLEAMPSNPVIVDGDFNLTEHARGVIDRLRDMKNRVQGEDVTTARQAEELIDEMLSYLPSTPAAVSNDRCVYPGCSRPDDKERHEWNDMHDWVPCCGAAQAKGPVLAVPFTEQEFLTRVFDWCEDWLEAHDKGVRPDVDYKAREFYRKHLSAQPRAAHDVCENSRDCIKCGKRIQPAGGVCFSCADELSRTAITKEQFGDSLRKTRQKYCSFESPINGQRCGLDRYNHDRTGMSDHHAFEAAGITVEGA